MNDRLIRGGIIDSDRVNSLSWAAECLYRRLQSLVDDYGNYDGREAIIRTNAFKLKLNQVSESDVQSWLQVCEKAVLISFYEVEGKSYLHLKDFRQKKRWMKRQYPPCPEESESPPKEEKRSRRDDEEKNAQARHPLQVFIENNFKNVSQIKSQLTFEECKRLVEEFDKRKIAAVLADMENKKGLASKYESVNLTLRKWIAMDFGKTNTATPGTAKQKKDLTVNIHKPVQSNINGKKGTITGVVDGTHYLVLFEDGTTNEARPHELYFPPQIPIQKTSEPQSIGNILGNIVPHKSQT